MQKARNYARIVFKCITDIFCIRIHSEFALMNNTVHGKMEVLSVQECLR